MKIKEIVNVTDNIYQYVFQNSDKNPHIDLNITVVLSGKNAYLIDIGYPRHSKYVKEDLLKRNIKPEKIILSHYHTDHVTGASEFMDVPISCSKHFYNNYKTRTTNPTNTFTYRYPDQIIDNGDKWTFGENQFKFIYTPGHSKCSMITIINDKTAHVGDLMLFSAYDKQAIPYICKDGDFGEHINSLKLIKNMEFDTLLLSHGKPLQTKEEINNAIDKRIFYLQSVIDTSGRGTLEECVEGSSNEWAFSKWHINNIRNYRLINRQK